jgi:hypothetical protein
MNVTYDEPGKEHLLMFIIGGNQPQAEFTPAAMRRCDEFSRQPQRPRRPKSRRVAEKGRVRGSGH